MSKTITQKDLDLALKRSVNEGLKKVNEIEDGHDRRANRIGKTDSYYSRSSRSYDLKKLSDVHYQIIRYLALGKKNAEIAELCDISPHTVSRIRNNDMTKLALKAIRFEMNKKAAHVAKRIANLSNDAMDVLENVVKGTGEFENIDKKERISASKDILSRAGHGYIKKVSKINTNVTDETLKNIKHQVVSDSGGLVSRRAKELAKDIEEADFVEE